MWCETRKSGLGIIWIRIRISTDTDCYRETTLSVACFSAWWLRMRKKYLTLKRLTLGSIRKVIPPSWCRCREWREGGGEVGWGWWNLSLEFLICGSISKQFGLRWKAFVLLDKMRYILWVVALLEVCDVTKHGRRRGRQELEIRYRLQKLIIVCTWHAK